MRYEACNGAKWIRPVKNIAAIVQMEQASCEVLNFNFAGVSSSNTTLGNKISSFFNGVDALPIDDIANYENILLAHDVIVDPGKRYDIIMSSIVDKIDITCTIKNLVDELVGIAEYPFAMICKIDERFLNLPKELLDYTMILHQKYIPLNGQEFMVIVNNKEITKSMKNGYERVLKARLSDAKFFYEQFISSSLQTLIYDLGRIPSDNPQYNILEYNEQIAYYYHCVFGAESDIKISADILNNLKCDLGSKLIEEYPALRGMMAARFNVNNQNAKALYYNANEIYERDKIDLDAHVAHRIVVIEKMLRLKYFICQKGESPTGSRDPYALKRDVMILTDIIIQIGQNFDLTKAYECMSSSFCTAADVSIVQNKQEDGVILFDFIKKNLAAHLCFGLDQFQTKIINYLIFEHEKGIDPVQTLRLLKLYENTYYSISKDLLAACKRVMQIYNKKYSQHQIDWALDHKSNILKSSEEISMIDLIDKLDGLAYMIDNSNDCTRSINNFFDNIFIEVDDLDLCKARINLVCKLAFKIKIFIPKFFFF